MSHLLLMKDNFDNQLKTMKKEYESQLSKRDEKIEQLERSLSHGMRKKKFCVCG